MINDTPIGLRPFIPEKELEMIAALDFDGVMNMYTGWAGEDELYEPRPGLELFLSTLKEIGYTIYIVTSRNPEKIVAWLKKHYLDNYIKEVTNQKVPAMFYLDDRGLTFKGDFEEALQQIENYKPHWKS